MSTALQQTKKELKQQQKDAYKVQDPRDRLGRLRIFRQRLLAFYNLGKPSKYLSKQTGKRHKFLATLIGAAVGAIVLGAVVLFTGPISVLTLPAAGLGLLAGAVAGYKIGVLVKSDKKLLREKYGTVRYAQKLYRTGKKTDKAIQKLAPGVELNDNFRAVQNTAPAPASVPVTATAQSAAPTPAATIAALLTAGRAALAQQQKAKP